MKYHHGDAISIIQTNDPPASANKSQEEALDLLRAQPLLHRDAERALRPGVILDG